MSPDRLGFPDKKLFNKHELCVGLFVPLEKIQDTVIKIQLEKVVQELNTVMMRIKKIDEGENANRQVEEAMAIIDNLNIQIDGFVSANSSDSVYLKHIKDHANQDVSSYLRKSVKK